MWNDKQNAEDHHADLLKVRARVASEKLQDQAPGQIGSAQDMKDYRLKTIDTLIETSSKEMRQVGPKTGEFYR